MICANLFDKLFAYVEKKQYLCTTFIQMKLENLTIGYGSHVVQKNLSLQIKSGDMVCVLGKNGCGKSTLLRTLSGLQPALGGACIMPDGRKVNELSEREKAQSMAIVLTERLSATNTTVEDVVAMGRFPYTGWLGALTNSDHDTVLEALRQTEMLHKRHCFFNELSDGEKQRVLISKALAQETPYIFLDEPTAHLDLPNRIKTLLLLRELAHNAGKAVIISTHELDLALQTADIIWLMTPAAGIVVGTPKNLVENGDFQQAFDDPHFCFTTADGTLRIQIR